MFAFGHRTGKQRADGHGAERKREAEWDFEEGGMLPCRDAPAFSLSGGREGEWAGGCDQQP